MVETIDPKPAYRLPGQGFFTIFAPFGMLLVKEHDKILFRKKNKSYPL